GRIANTSTLAVTNSTFSGSSSRNPFSRPTIFNGVGTEGGNGGTVTVTNSTFAGNSAAGAILNVDGTVIVTDSTFTGNSSGAFENRTFGAIFNFANTAGAATLTVTNSTFAGNSAGTNFGGDGGAIANEGGTVTVTNSTFSGNSGCGGALFNFGFMVGTLTVTNSILANNTSTCLVPPSIITDGGYNIDDGTTYGFTGAGCSNTRGTSLCNTNALLDPAGLANNGGPTQTIALQAGSPAIDAVPIALCPPTDQRGARRIDPADVDLDLERFACDIGAFESNIVESTTTTPTTTVTSPSTTVRPTTTTTTTATSPSTTARPTTTTSTMLPCTTARCTLDAALMSPRCVGQSVPASVTRKLRRAENLIDQPATTPPNKPPNLRPRPRHL